MGSNHKLVLSATERRAVDLALRVRERAYAPYSQRKVGAALIASDGTIFEGCNVENETDGLGVCAERNAVAAAVSAGRREFRLVVVAAPDERLWPPCDSCRPVLSEFAPNLNVIMVNSDGALHRAALIDLQSRPFHLDDGDSKGLRSSL